jgi:hypothetical protein
MLLGLAVALSPRNKHETLISTLAIIVLVSVNLISTRNFSRGADYIQSTYIIPWGKIALDIEKDYKPQSALVFDDNTLVYWTIPNKNWTITTNINDLIIPENLILWDKPSRIIFVYSPRDITAQHRLPRFLELLDQNYTLKTEIPYLTEDATSIRWKTMLFRRDFEPVKKVLRVYDRR